MGPSTNQTLTRPALGHKPLSANYLLGSIMGLITLIITKIAAGSIFASTAVQNTLTFMGLAGASLIAQVVIFIAISVLAITLLIMTGVQLGIYYAQLSHAFSHRAQDEEGRPKLRKKSKNLSAKKRASINRDDNASNDHSNDASPLISRTPPVSDTQAPQEQAPQEVLCEKVEIIPSVIETAAQLMELNTQALDRKDLVSYFQMKDKACLELEAQLTEYLSLEYKEKATQEIYERLNISAENNHGLDILLRFYNSTSNPQIARQYLEKTSGIYISAVYLPTQTLHACLPILFALAYKQSPLWEKDSNIFSNVLFSDAKIYKNAQAYVVPAERANPDFPREHLVGIYNAFYKEVQRRSALIAAPETPILNTSPWARISLAFILESQKESQEVTQQEFFVKLEQKKKLFLGAYGGRCPNPFYYPDFSQEEKDLRLAMLCYFTPASLQLYAALFLPPDTIVPENHNEYACYKQYKTELSHIASQHYLQQAIRILFCMMNDVSTNTNLKNFKNTQQRYNNYVLELKIKQAFEALKERYQAIPNFDCEDAIKYIFKHLSVNNITLELNYYIDKKTEEIAARDGAILKINLAVTLALVEKELSNLLKIGFALTMEQQEAILKAALTIEDDYFSYDEDKISELTRLCLENYIIALRQVQERINQYISKELYSEEEYLALSLQAMDAIEWQEDFVRDILPIAVPIIDADIISAVVNEFNAAKVVQSQSIDSVAPPAIAPQPQKLELPLVVNIVSVPVEMGNSSVSVDSSQLNKIA